MTYKLMQHISKQVSCNADDFLKDENIVTLEKVTEVNKDKYNQRR